MNNGTADDKGTIVMSIMVSMYNYNIVIVGYVQLRSLHTSAKW